MAKGDNLQERFGRLAAAIILLCRNSPKDDGAKHLVTQLLRSGTSPAPNYAEARGAESDRNFIHKLKIVLKESEETIQWLQVGIWSNIWSRDQKVWRAANRNRPVRCSGNAVVPQKTWSPGLCSRGNVCSYLSR
jgi:four helix bundle protein